MSEYFVTGDDVLKLVNAIRLIETSAYRGTMIFYKSELESAHSALKSALQMFSEQAKKNDNAEGNNE